MFNGMNAMVPSVADIAAAVGGRNNENGWGGDGWWILIILFAIFGWGGNGYGFGGNGSNGVGAEVQRGFDTSTIISKLDGINNGICSLGYDQLAQMNTINANVTNTGFNVLNAIQQQTIAQMQDTNALSRQLADCCCENRAAIAQVRYDMATDTCAITTAIQNAARDIVDNQNAAYRALHEENVQALIAAKDARIQEQASLINGLNLVQSQANQTRDIRESILNELRTCPVGTYTVPNPNFVYGPWGANNWAGYFNNGCCNRDCGC